MMRSISALTVLLVLCGCNNEAKSAEADYASLREVNASADLRCKAASVAAEAWGRAGDKAKYKEWSDTQKWNCIDADICRNDPAICK